MNEHERQRLEKEYRGLADGEIIEMALLDPKEFPKGVYEIVQKEVKRRNLEAAVAAQRDPVEEDRDSIKVVEIYRALNVPEADMIALLLERHTIECTYSEFPLSSITPVGIFSSDKFSAVRMYVREADAAAARRIIKDHLDQKP